jgi:hypothetical protein
MVVYDFDVRRPACALGPLEANPPLDINADAELPCPIAFQAFKAVAGQRPQIFKAHRGVQNFKALERMSVETLKVPDKLAAREYLGSFVAEVKDHLPRIGRRDDLRQA